MQNRYRAHASVCVLRCPAVSDSCSPMDCSPPGSSVHGILQARILEWVAISFSTRLSQSSDQIHVTCLSYIGRRILYHQRHLGKSKSSYFCFFSQWCVLRSVYIIKQTAVHLFLLIFFSMAVQEETGERYCVWP